MPDDIPRTWILTRRDRALAPKVQHKYFDGVGGVQTPIEMDTCHCMMIREPERLAKILLERCRLAVKRLRRDRQGCTITATMISTPALRVASQTCRCWSIVVWQVGTGLLLAEVHLEGTPKSPQVVLPFRSLKDPRGVAVDGAGNSMSPTRSTDGCSKLPVGSTSIGSAARRGGT